MRQLYHILRRKTTARKQKCSKLMFYALLHRTIKHVIPRKGKALT